MHDGTRAVAAGTASWTDYLSLARLDHVTKHIFILPGIALALLLRGVQSPSLALSIVVGIILAVCIASANYVINEYLDRESDRHHPEKCMRASVQVDIRPLPVFTIWLALVSVSLALATMVSTLLFVAGALFAVQGIVYNVRPLRSKDVPYLDVLSEAVNNPLRLVIGWLMIDPYTLPPGSILLAYWFGGAFLMGAKRLSEYRDIAGKRGTALLERYRKSFAGYTESKLAVSCFVYSLYSLGFLGIFLIKYRVEYLLALPLVIWLFGYYLALSFLDRSTAQAPEKLFKERKLMAIAGLAAAAFAVLTIVELPALEGLTEQQFITVHGAM